MCKTRIHAIPFGSSVLSHNHVRFRLWAPSAECVDLCIKANNHCFYYPMRAIADGWFELVQPNAPSGTLYRYRIDKQIEVPDPAARYQPEDVHGFSQVVDPSEWAWKDTDWRGRSWEEAVIYELHVGSFTKEGTFSAVSKKLDFLRDLGITAIELMPIADFPGRFNWGYDGVLPYAPDSRYGTPNDLKSLIETAHSKGLMVFLDVVYNHFGPEGNYLHHYASDFFSRKRHTPWGKAFNFDGRNSYWARQFLIDNALYWLEEFNIDGLRLDAVQTISDDSPTHFLEELASRVKQKIGTQRTVHLILENDDNAAHYLQRNDRNLPISYTAQWNDDFHHALHVLATGERWGVYGDYADDPLKHLIRCLKEGFSYQGESSHFRRGRNRGESSTALPATAFIGFLQNHDQIGNRPFAERITGLITAPAVRAATALLLLAPFPPMLFMGQEWGCQQPFRFFCDLESRLCKRVTRARRHEFRDVPGLETSKARTMIPRANAFDSFSRSVLAWPTDVEALQWRDFHRRLLTLRRLEIVPRLAGTNLIGTKAERLGQYALLIEWQLGDGSHLGLLANLGQNALDKKARLPKGRLLFSTHTESLDRPLPPWSIYWTLEDADSV
ncbi:MAG: malto-oligosyltrehalose trehalohydrolase [Gammaproteobacteria bacterium]